MMLSLLSVLYALLFCTDISVTGYEAPDYVYAVPFADSLSASIDSTVVSSVRISERVPVAFSEMDAPQLKATSSSSSLPQALSLLPSVVAVSECGTGVGYTSFSVRGISGYHTNVTLNGITLGDSETQEVFWVNIPSLTTILSSVQLQRGLGTASCGPGAFGASLNMTTESPVLYGGSASGGYGSFGTWTTSARAWSGTLKNGFFADASFNWQQTDGYIRNAPAKVWSTFANVGWKGRRDMVQAVFLQGWQRSAITWNGVPFEVYPHDRRFNISEGDTDNFRQSHLQLNYRHEFSSAWKWNNVLNYTRGYGWYDIKGNSDYLKNDLYVLRSDLSYSRKSLTVTATAYLSQFVGDHWGSGYADTARKSEEDVSLRAEWSPLKPLTLFGEVQYRGVQYNLYSIRHSWNFCNPRLGVNWSPSSFHKLYAFTAIGHREPARADFDSNPAVRDERMYDFEVGYKFSLGGYVASVNLYDMEYRDMLLETGSLDGQGYLVKDNVPAAFRRGVELECDIKALTWLNVGANCSFSDNRIRESGRSLLLSPSIIAGAVLKLMPWKGFEFCWNAKYVGSQYYNNTGMDVSGRVSSEVPAYFFCDLSASQTFNARYVKITLSAYLNNVFDREYYAYAYNYGVYPAATRNGSLKLTLDF